MFKYVGIPRFLAPPLTTPTSAPTPAPTPGCLQGLPPESSARVQPPLAAVTQVNSLFALPNSEFGTGTNQIKTEGKRLSQASPPPYIKYVREKSCLLNSQKF